ncbi:MAG: response regulator transcription factor [Deferribacteres bacterium]|nr:response regulator transcription factor [candidate division KSB1 bacterium]MCB9508823.1 response regulator transcription factor [Deferribacteres bacterium]
MNAKQILLIEDESGIAQMIRVQLQLVGFSVHAVEEAQAALSLPQLSEFDLIILDWMLPDGNGPDLIPQLRQRSNAPILMLTARSEIVDKLIGFESGADDYLTKPFDMMELIARIKALLRRSGSAVQRAKIPALRFRELVLEPDTRRVTIAGDEVELTPTEFKILEIFLQAPGSVFSRDKLIELVMGYEYEGYGRTLDSHIARLRGKIELDIKSPEYIKTVFGVGYKLGD